MIDTPLQENDSGSQVQSLLQQVNAGDAGALNRLIEMNCQRLENLTRHMLQAYPALRRWEETDDILQNAMLRLLRALEQVQPESARHFLALAALQIRRELIDTARRLFGPAGLATNQESRGGQSSAAGVAEGADLSHEPSTLAQWCELHEQIGALAEQEREVVDLLYYEGLSQANAASLLGVSVRTVQRRWHAALVSLHKTLQGHWPGL